MMDGVKMISATILDFAEPLLELVPDGAPMKTRREALTIAITFWNCLVMEEVGDPTFAAEFRAAHQHGPPDARALMDGALAALRSRKKLRYPEMRLLVGKWELRDLGDGRESLYAEAHVTPGAR